VTRLKGKDGAVEIRAGAQQRLGVALQHQSAAKPGLPLALVALVFPETTQRGAHLETTRGVARSDQPFERGAEIVRVRSRLDQAQIQPGARPVDRGHTFQEPAGMPFAHLRQLACRTAPLLCVRAHDLQHCELLAVIPGEQAVLHELRQRSGCRQDAIFARGSCVSTPACDSPAKRTKATVHALSRLAEKVETPGQRVPQGLVPVVEIARGVGQRGSGSSQQRIAPASWSKVWW
jgi:hypothetical protein